MQKALLIAEKPSLRREIEATYNKNRGSIPYEITFFEQRGHLITLKTPDEIDDELKEWSWDTLPINPEDYGGFRYKVIEEKKVGSFKTAKERYSDIRTELRSGKYNFVINAGDPDQEGELLIRIVLASLKNTLPVKRYWTNATTEEKILEALINLQDDDNDPRLKNLLAAAYGRQHSDWRFGMNLSRASTLKMGARVACGRIRTPLLSIVCKRELDIKSFKPSTRYGVKVNYSEGFSGQLFDSAIEVEENANGKEKKSDDKAGSGLVWFDTEEEAEECIEGLYSPAKVTVYETEKSITYAPKLFKLSTAQVAAGKIGIDIENTLATIQSLYEKGYMSYPRTDCEYLSSTENLSAMLNSASAVPELAPCIASIAKETIGKVKGTKKWINDKALEESGHSALAPTTKKPNLSELTEEEVKIYTLVCRQFVAIFLPPLIQNKTYMVTEISGKTFKTSGKTLIDPGYTTIFGTKFTDTEVPAHVVGEFLSVEGFEPVTKTTVCPKHLTKQDLINICDSPQKYLEDARYKSLGKNLKIGTQATRTNIINELINRDKYLYTEKEKSAEYLLPTETGMMIYENLKDCAICRVDLTAEWEEELEKVRRGELTLNDLESGMKSHVERLVNDIKNADMTVIGRKEYAIICKCPKCDGDIKSGPKSFYCSNYKDGCKVGAFNRVWESKVSDDEFVALLNGQEITKKVKYKSSVWEANLVYDFETSRINAVTHKSESVYRCPKCGKKLEDDGRALNCTDGCFKFWKTVPGGKAITVEQFDKFFSEGTTGIIKGMKGKSGKSFNAELVLKEDKSGTELKFAERKQ